MSRRRRGVGMRMMCERRRICVGGFRRNIR